MIELDLFPLFPFPEKIGWKRDLERRERESHKLGGKRNGRS